MKVSWDDDSQYMEKKNVPNHQPDKMFSSSKSATTGLYKQIQARTWWFFNRTRLRYTDAQIVSCTHITYVPDFTDSSPDDMCYWLLTAPSAEVRGNGLLWTNQLTIPCLNVDTRLVIWQCVKTNSTPVVHIKIAGIYGCSSHSKWYFHRYWSIAILDFSENPKEKCRWNAMRISSMGVRDNLQAIARASHVSRRNDLSTGKKTMFFLWFSMIFPSNPWTFIREIWWLFHHAFLNMSGAFTMVSWTVKSHVWWFNPHFSVTDYLMVWASNSSLCLCGRRLRGNT